MNISWEDARLFLSVAEAGSFSGAARELRLGQPTVTRRLAALEYTVGTALFRRSVSGAALTTAGERLLPAAKKMAEWAGELHRAAKAGDGAPQGVVRVTASPWGAFDFLAPFAGHVAKKHPALKVEVLSSIQYLDLGRGEADLALRPVAPKNPDLKVVHTLRVPARVFVSRELKRRLPKKVTPATLPWVAWSQQYDEVPPNPQLRALVPDFSPVFTADNFLVLVAAAQAGVGALALADFKHRFRRHSPLVPLNLDLGPYGMTEIHLVCAKSALDIPRVRRVAELLTDELTFAQKQ